jgi:heat shock protein HslJ
MVPKEYWEVIMIKRSIIFTWIVLLSVTALIAGACTNEEGGDFEDIKWTLESYGGNGNTKMVLEGTEITATFNSDEHRVSGSAGCNSYFGEYQKDGKELTIKQVGNTEMYCMDPEGVMEQESEYLKLLMHTDSYEVDDEKLQISSGNDVLVFNKK